MLDSERMQKEGSFPITEVLPEEFPALLNEIPDPPEKLFLRGILPPEDNAVIAVVGSRKYSSYGKQAVEVLVRGLRGYNITIVSGLAIGIDALAHKAALDAHILTVAVLGSGLHDTALYPRTHKGLAYAILEAGGALISEFEPSFEATPWSFPRRNRIMAGLSHAVLVIEAAERSGTLITSRLATDYNREVLAVPGSMFSKNSRGPHMLIRLGATPINSAEDIVDALDLTNRESSDKGRVELEGCTPEEHIFLALLHEPLTRDELIRRSKMSVKDAQIALSMMELRGYIAEENGLIVSLV